MTIFRNYKYMYEKSELDIIILSNEITVMVGNYLETMTENMDLMTSDSV